jgi:4-methylaminobutanoate oxidase (formaldehyde-forming)
VGLGYVPCRYAGETVKEMLTSTYQIDVAGRMVGAEASTGPLYDPKSQRVRV